MISHDDMERRLAHIPIAERAEVREFVSMEPLDQRILLYTEIKSLQALIRESLDNRWWKTGVGSYIYTTALVIGAIAAAVNGKIPTIGGG